MYITTRRYRVARSSLVFSRRHQYHCVNHYVELCRAQRLLTHSLYERLQSNDRLKRGYFVASFKHVQEREFPSGLERAVLHAIDSVWHQRRRVELSRLLELNLGDDGLHASSVTNPVYVSR